MGSGTELRADPGDASMGESFRGPWSYLLSVRKPIVAAINGPTAGLGFAAALFADVRFASEQATFTTAFSRRGLIAEWGIGWTLPRLVGTAHALELLWSARVFGAAEAERIGLVNKRAARGRAAALRARLGEGAGGELLARLPRHHEAPGLHVPHPGARPGDGRGDPPDARELRAAPTSAKASAPSSRSAPRSSSASARRVTRDSDRAHEHSGAGVSGACASSSAKRAVAAHPGPGRRHRPPPHRRGLIAPPGAPAKAQGRLQRPAHPCLVISALRPCTIAKGCTPPWRAGNRLARGASLRERPPRGRSGPQGGRTEAPQPRSSAGRPRRA